MLPIPVFYTSNASLRAGPVLREMTPRADRVPFEDRVDLPEIQESFRVSFSDEARAQSAAMPPDNPPGHATGLGPTGLAAYRRVAGY